jgi:SAM-dependent methyltransferase
MDHPKIYSSEYYQRIFDLENRHWWHLGMRHIAANLIRSATSDQLYVRVLDAGCGTGGAMVWARDCIGAEIAVGVDISFEAIDHCHHRFDLPLAQGSTLELPFRSDIFDLVICQDVLQHLPTNGSDLHALKEIHKVMRPGGFVLIRTNSRRGMWQANSDKDSDYQRYTLPEIVSRIRAAGFILKRATYANALPSLYTSAKRYVKLKFGRRNRHQHLYDGLDVRDTGSRQPWLNRILLWILKLEATFLLTPDRKVVFGHSIFCLGMKPFNDEGNMLIE